MRIYPPNLASLCFALVIVFAAAGCDINLVNEPDLATHSPDSAVDISGRTSSLDAQFSFTEQAIHESLDPFASDKSPARLDASSCDYGLDLKSIYPNPAPKGPWIYGDVELQGGLYDFYVEVYNNLGQLVLSRYAGRFGTSDPTLKLPNLKLWRGLYSNQIPVPDGTYNVKLKAAIPNSTCFDIDQKASTVVGGVERPAESIK